MLLNNKQYVCAGNFSTSVSCDVALCSLALTALALLNIPWIHTLHVHTRSTKEVWSNNSVIQQGFLSSQQIGLEATKSSWVLRTESTSHGHTHSHTQVHTSRCVRQTYRDNLLPWFLTRWRQGANTNTVSQHFKWFPAGVRKHSSASAGFNKTQQLADALFAEQLCALGSFGGNSYWVVLFLTCLVVVGKQQRWEFDRCAVCLHDSSCYVSRCVGLFPS